MDMKECTKCHKVLPESSFYKRRNTGGLQSHCIDCCKAHGRLRNGRTGIYKTEENNLNYTIMNEDLNARVEIITPDIAKEYLKFNAVNRPLNKKTVDFYAKQMRNKEWKLNGEAICFLRGGALGNGQHRLSAIIQAKIPVKMLVIRNCEEDSFITYDSGRNRTVADIFSLSEIPNSNAVSSIVRKYFYFSFGLTAISASMGKSGELTTDKKKSKKELLDEYNSKKELYQKAHAISDSCSGKLRLMAASEIGGMFVYLVKDKKHPIEYVESFFRMLFFKENVSNDTINILRDRIIQDKLSNKIMSSTYKSTLITKTWNCYVTGKVLKSLSWNESKEGKVLFL